MFSVFNGKRCQVLNIQAFGLSESVLNPLRKKNRQNVGGNA